ncbi:serine/threonine protein kinase [Promineifilum sp.]|uniref:serine/threonine protein kinase n=1 Tax=Promineifilum sp. TaxID=2664178 RepID=UPI0035AF41FC
MALNPGTVINNRYRIVRLVGQGGFGAVYRAWDLSLGQPVALKENADAGVESQRQFEREAKLLAGLRHPNLPVVIDHFIIPGQGQYLVMDYVEGKSLSALLVERGGRLPEPEVLPWVRQVCDALTYLHTRTPPVIHRDIKPDNIILTGDGRAMLVDFGISKVYDPGGSTTVGAKAVTPGYSPPEQYGRAGTDARSDVYALGATLYTLLTGQVPPDGPDLSSGAQALTPPRRLNPAISEEMSQAIMAAMMPSISQRLGSATAFRDALTTRVFVSPQQTARPASAPVPVKKRRVSRLVWLLGALIPMAVAVAWVWMTYGNPFDRLRAAEPPAAIVGGAETPGAPVIAVATEAGTPITTATVEQTPSATAPAATTTVAPTKETAAPAASSTTEATTAQPADVPAATATPTPPPATATATATQVAISEPATTADWKHINQPWEQDGVSLTARTLEIRPENDSQNPAARVWFRLVNKTGQRLLVEINWANIFLEDSFGTRYVDFEGGETTSVWVETGANYDFDRQYTVTPGQRSRVPGDAAFVQVTVTEFSRVKDARWQYPINAALQPVVGPAEGEAKTVGEAWEQEGLALRLADIRVLAESDSGDAAARVWFELTNTTNQEWLAEIDFGHIYLTDSFGRHFGDWDGGGIFARSIRPGDTLRFDRYYSEMSGRRSRISRGTGNVVVTVESLGRLTNALWNVPVDVRLSTVNSAGRETPLNINQAWEQEGVSLTARTLEIRAESDSQEPAARVWFRLLNKTGQPLLITLDWSKLYLQDSAGTRYVDFEGEGMTSVWVQTGQVYDFDRHYTVTPDQRSRVPSNAAFVQVVVEGLSRISNARWQYDINPNLQPVAEPADGATRAVGEAWEQDGVALRLADLRVQAESDSGDAAARAWFEVTNSTAQRVIVEIDLGHLYLTDSFGRVFGDWDGGGLYAVTIEPGATARFDRYYSEMSGRRSRITRGALFVLLHADRTMQLENALWRVNINR